MAGKRNQLERNEIRRPCILILRTALAYKQLKRYPFIYWTCPPDHGKKTPAQAKALKLDGYEAGVYDLTIIAGNNDISFTWLIEFKYGKNTLTDEQEAIWRNAAGIKNISSLIIRTPKEFEEFLSENLK